MSHDMEESEPCALPRGLQNDLATVRRKTLIQVKKNQFKIIVWSNNNTSRYMLKLKTGTQTLTEVFKVALFNSQKPQMPKYCLSADG